MSSAAQAVREVPESPRNSPERLPKNSPKKSSVKKTNESIEAPKTAVKRRHSTVEVSREKIDVETSVKPTQKRTKKSQEVSEKPGDGGMEDVSKAKKKKKRISGD
ncbi:unnamed protein product [Notodromas monacha]|uniref:Uncharacterized protein n=1 Tax=Notodromas monacha TaxID=399045 RepID=A0A7R9BR14_9CRUS|nr:unnamed protein product [Notodromas monacha]CAG0920101.1 unnamed protein product [Notodromas monacha]